MKRNKYEKVSQDFIEICEKNEKFFKEEKLDETLKVFKKVLEKENGFFKSKTDTLFFTENYEKIKTKSENFRKIFKEKSNEEFEDFQILLRVYELCLYFEVCRDYNLAYEALILYKRLVDNKFFESISFKVVDFFPFQFNEDCSSISYHNDLANKTELEKVNFVKFFWVSKRASFVYSDSKGTLFMNNSNCGFSLEDMNKTVGMIKNQIEKLKPVFFENKKKKKKK